MKHKYLLPALVVLAAVVVLYAIIMTQQTPVTTEAPQTIAEKTTLTEEVATESTSTRTVERIHPDDWSETTFVQERLYALSLVDELIVDGIVEDPSNEGTFYFATSWEHPSQDMNRMSVYMYDANLQAINQLYSTDYFRGSYGSLSIDVLPQFYVQGVENDELIIFVADVDISLNPCEEPILTAQEPTQEYRLVRVHPDTPTTLRLYEVDDDLKTELLDREARCNK